MKVENVALPWFFFLFLPFSYDITSPEFAQQLQPFLFEKTAHFVHEFVSFAQAPYDMVAYDEKAEYDVPPDGVPLPELVPLEDEPGIAVMYDVFPLWFRWLLAIS